MSDTLASASNRSWVAVADGRITGFVVAGIADPARSIGEIVMLAVDPARRLYEQAGFRLMPAAQYFKVL